MAKCAYCDARIILGGKKSGLLKYCNSDCLEKGEIARLAGQFSPEMIQAEVSRVHQGHCPECNSRGEIEVHVSYRVWSALVLTSWSSRPQICCVSCGRKHKLIDTAFSLVLGWWGIPFGLIITPIQVVRNLAGLFIVPDPSAPSGALVSAVKTRMVIEHGLRENR